MDENTKYASSSVEAGHTALNGGEPLTGPEPRSNIWLCGRSYTKENLELIIDLWTLLERIEKMKDEDKRDTAEANWFELYRAFCT